MAHIRGVEDAQEFAEMWVANTGTDKNASYWENNTRLLITAMVLHLLETEKTPALSRLADILTTSSFKEIQELLTRTRSLPARRLAAQFLESLAANDRLTGSVMTDLVNRFQLLASPQARAATATNDIDFEEMIETPTAFFLAIPRNAIRRYQPLMACLMTQMFTAWERRGQLPGGGIGCYLDEFTNLGYIPGYADFIATARGLRVSLLMAIQSHSQIDERYGREDAETIRATAVTHLLLPGAGLRETKYYSERIGNTTVRTETINRRGSGLTREITSSQGETARRLMTPDELRRMPEDTMLMLEAASQPLLLKTMAYFQDKELASRASVPAPAATRIRRIDEEPEEVDASTRIPAGKSPPAPIVVDADPDQAQDDGDETIFFQKE